MRYEKISCLYRKLDQHLCTKILHRIPGGGFLVRRASFRPRRKKLSGADYSSRQVNDNGVGDGQLLMVVVAALVVMAIKLIFYYMW